MGPELAFDGDVMVAVTGAELTPQINGDPRPRWETLPVKSGDVLSFGFITAGARAFVAVSHSHGQPVHLCPRRLRRF